MGSKKLLLKQREAAEAFASGKVSEGVEKGFSELQ